MSLTEKKQFLESHVRELESVVVAFSGGVDSALVLAVAHKVLGPKVLAATARSESLPEREFQGAQKLARYIGAKHRIVFTREMELEQYHKNPTNRCYFCKTELYTHLQKIVHEEGYHYILNGTNTDDLGDYRPGLIAADQLKVRSPLLEAGLNKADVRELAREMGLPVWDKPAAACLSSRVPYDEPITTEKLKMIELAEDFLMSLGYTQLRVRHFDGTARIELLPDEMSRFFGEKHSRTVEDRLKEIGFQLVVLDPKGYRSGSLNELLENK